MQSDYRNVNVGITLIIPNPPTTPCSALAIQYSGLNDPLVRTGLSRMVSALDRISGSAVVLITSLKAERIQQ